MSAHIYEIEERAFTEVTYTRNRWSRRGIIGLEAHQLLDEGKDNIKINIGFGINLGLDMSLMMFMLVLMLSLF
jgi:hypothetical protein